jgi:signal transduction histidine kinase
MPVIDTDEAAFERVVQNLLENALKFAPDAEPPRVRIDAERRLGAWRFRVADRGIGVPAGQRDRIFTIFQRLHPREAYGGLGLGLAICKKLVEQQGGRIGVDDTPDGGSTFWFTVPDLAVR